MGGTEGECGSGGEDAAAGNGSFIGGHGLLLKAMAVRVSPSPRPSPV